MSKYSCLHILKIFLWQSSRYGVVKIAEKSTAVFVLSLIDGIFIPIAGMVVAVATAVLGRVIGALFPIVVGLLALVGALGLVFGILVIVGAVVINSGETGKVKTGSTLVLVFSILSLFVAGGGFIIGFILGLIGGILALTWKPPAKPAPTPPPPSPPPA